MQVSVTLLGLPIQVRSCTLNGQVAQNLLDDDPAMQLGELAAVAWRRVGDDAREPLATRAGGIARDHVGLAGEIFADMARNEPHGRVVGAAGRRANV